LKKLLETLNMPYLEDEPLGVHDGFYGYRFIAAKYEKDLPELQRLVRERETKENATKLGEYMGFPATAIAAYGTAGALDVDTDLPPDEAEKLANENLRPFAILKLSKAHYKDELNRI